MNPATLLPDLDLEVLLYDCSGVLVQYTALGQTCGTLYCLRRKLPGIQRQKVWGAAVTIKEEVIWAESVSAGTSTQQAELIALTKAPELNQGPSINFCTNNWYSLLWRIYKER